MRFLRAVVLAFALLIGVTHSSHSYPVQYNWFYRFVVDLVHGDEPISIEVIVACGSESRQILGEARSVRAIRAPYIYGVRTKGDHGVLVQTPDICNRDVAKNPVPADFLPIVFWAPKASDLEFLIAYLHESAYEQPVSKLKFVRATVTDATRRDYEEWRATKWKENIVPIGDREADHARGISFFRGDGFFPSGDARNQRGLRMECRSFIKLPIPDAVRERIRAGWPAERPQYWLLDTREVNDILAKYGGDISKAGIARGLGSDADFASVLTSFWEGWGIPRRSGIGHLGQYPNERVAGLSLRIPYRVETGYPWASDRLFGQSTIDVHADTANGADQGFAYCFRDVYAHYFYDRKRRRRVPLVNRIFIDGRLIGTWENVMTRAPGATIIERDQFIWRPFSFPLTYELARMQ